jgi:hypothetical protein
MAVTKSFVAYHHQLGKKIVKASGGLIRTQSLRMVVKK